MFGSLTCLAVLSLLPFAPQGNRQFAGPRSDENVKRLIGRLSLRDKAAVDKAIDDLAKLGRIAVPHLIPLVEDARIPRGIRMNCLEILGRMGSEAAPAMRLATTLLTDKDPGFRTAGVAIISRIGKAAPGGYETLLRMWEDKDTNARRMAMYASAQLTPDRAELLPKLVGRLATEPLAVRFHIVRALGEFYGPKAASAFDQVAAQLGSDLRALAEEASVTLGKLGSTVTPRLIELVPTLDGDARSRAVAALGRIRPLTEQQLAALRDMYVKPDTRAAASESLREIGAAAVPTLAALLDRADETLLKRLLLDLATIGNPSGATWKTIAGFLDDERESIRIAAANVFAKSSAGVAPAVPAMIAKLDDSSVAVRRNLVLGISLCGPAGVPALPRLLEMLDQDDERLAQRIIEAFSRLAPKDEATIAELTKRLGAEADKRRGRAIRALVSIGTTTLPSVARSLEAARSVRAKLGALQVIREIGPSPAVLPLCERMLDSDSAVVRRDAALVLTRVKTGASAKRTAGRLAQMFQDRDQQVRIAAVTAFGIVGRTEKDAVGRLAALLKDRDTAVRYSSIEALGWPDNAKAVPILTRVLKDKDAFARLRAIQSLQRIGAFAGDALPVLRFLFQNDDSSMVRAAAAKAYNDIGGFGR